MSVIHQFKMKMHVALFGGWQIKFNYMEQKNLDCPLKRLNKSLLPSDCLAIIFLISQNYNYVCGFSLMKSGLQITPTIGS